ATDERGERLSALREHAAAGRETCIREGVDEDTVLGEEIRVVVAVVCARVDRVGVAVHELRNLVIVERRQRGGLRVGRCAAGFETAEKGGDAESDKCERRQLWFGHRKLLEATHSNV